METSDSITEDTANIKDTDPTRFKHTLLTIPPEIRLLIYEAYFSPFTLDRSKPRPALMRTCKLIRKEALDVYRARLIQAYEERGTKHEAANAALKHLTNAYPDTLERLRLELDQLSIMIGLTSSISDHYFELTELDQMWWDEFVRFNLRISAQISPRISPRKRTWSVSYMKGVEIPEVSMNISHTQKLLRAGEWSVSYMKGVEIPEKV